MNFSFQLFKHQVCRKDFPSFSSPQHRVEENFVTCLVTQTTWTKKKRKKRTRIALTYAGTVHDMMILSSTRVFERERVIFFVAEPTMYIYIDILDDTFNHTTLLFFIHLLEILTVRYMMCTICCTNDSGVVVL